MGFGVREQRSVLERLYQDRAELLHPETTRQGALTRSEFTVAAQDVPCSLSRLGNKSNRVGNKSGRDTAVQKILWDGVLFLAPEWPLEPGDRVRVRQLGKTLEFEIVGRPAMYETHQEALLRESGSA